MQRLKHIIVLLLAATVVGLVDVPPSYAQVVCSQSGQMGRCVITVEQGGTATKGSTGGTVTINGQVCDHISRYNPDLETGGGTPANSGQDSHPGMIQYACFTAPTAAGQGRVGVKMILFWSDTPLDTVDPEQLAQQAVSSMDLMAPRIGIAPRSAPGSIGLVGLQNWMWVDNPDAQTFGANTAKASAGSFTVTVTAKVESVDWDMGDGQVITCYGPGTPYNVNLDGFNPSPDCGHVYEKQGYYTVTATAHWRIDWVGAGDSGTIRMDLAATAPITIGEWQTLRKK